MHKIEETREMLSHLTTMKYAPASTSIAAYSTAIDKLKAYVEEDLPVRPKQYKSHPEDIFMCQCGSTFIVNELGTKFPYCPICGTKQDWSGSDEMV